MKKLFFVAFTFFLINSAKAQHVLSYNADELMQRASSRDTLYIINFWATWCPPCVAELPCFDTLQKQYASKPVKIILASFDFKESYPNKIVAFIKKKNVLPEVVWFNETDANSFIPKIDSTWSGSIPSTIILQPAKGYKTFFENTITVKQVSNIVNTQLGL
ncbi:MAG TPA: redoxin family protein [Flavipsychrobacter sp.]|nr:redoxin family protein [Flavipsychrobacter sp.]